MGPLVVLAYSGGLDTSAIVPWLRERYSARVLCFAADVKAKGVPVPATAEKPYSTDRNLWHCSHEGGILEDPSKEAPEDIFVMTSNPFEAPDTPQIVEIGFDEGTPVAVDHVPLGPVE